MTRTNKFAIEFVVLIVFGAITGIIISFSFSQKPQESAVAYLPSPVANAITTTIPTLTPLPPTPRPTLLPTLTTVNYVAPTTETPTTETFSQTSPDGTQILTMTVTRNPNSTRTFTFVTSAIDGTNQHSIYTVTYASDNMSIPFNTWSPDNNYVFINHINSTNTEALVFKADGTPVTASQNFVDVNDIYVSANTGFTYQETTGWSSNTLLIINTTAVDGSQGTSYWLSLPDLSIIPLATKF